MSTSSGAVFGVQSLAIVFETVDWIVPAYIQLGILGKMAERIAAAALPEEKHRILEETLPKIYNADELAAMLLDRYTKVPLVAPFKEPIGEAIEAAQLGLYHVAVSALVAVLEGIIRQFAIKRGQPLGNGTKELADEIDEMITRQHSDPSMERVPMLESFRDLLRNKLLINTSKFQGQGNLNRHGILHGVFKGYGSACNFAKAISFLDLLCFFATLESSGISALGPDRTNRSQKLAQYYRLLGALQPTAKSHGARV